MNNENLILGILWQNTAPFTDLSLLLLSCRLRFDVARLYLRKTFSTCKNHPKMDYQIVIDVSENAEMDIGNSNNAFWLILVSIRCSRVIHFRWNY